MPNVLIVDDSPADRTLAARLLQKEPNLDVAFASDGNDALTQIRRQVPDVVVTDLQMPQSDGLQLVEALKRDFPRLPVILMTARGSEDIAAEALKKGAASYVPKTALAVHLRDTVVRVLSAAAADSRHSRLMHALAECRCWFVIQNDLELIETLTGHLQEMLRCMPLGGEAERLRVAIAVKQALLNGLYHGNLEIPFELDATAPAAAALVHERITSSPWADRLVVLQADVQPQQATFTVTHEGPGFPEAARIFEFSVLSSAQQFLRGLVLMHSGMDEVKFNPGGQSVTLVKRAIEPSELQVSE